MPMKPEMTEFWEPEVPVITPGKTLGEAPSDAIVLFDGKNLDQWAMTKDGSPAKWVVKNGYFEVLPGTGDLQTKMKFGDCQLHIEFSAPDVVEGNSQGRGNSGIFFRTDMNCKCWTPIITGPIAMARLEVFIKIMHHSST